MQDHHKTPKIDPSCKYKPKVWCLTILANNPNRAQFSDLLSPRTSLYENECHFLLIYTKFNLKLVSVHNYWADLAIFLHIKSGQNKINLHPENPPWVISCPSKVTLSPICGTLSWKSGALYLHRPKMIPTRATRLTKCLQNETLALDDV
jgi:hypothetical protein